MDSAADHLERLATGDVDKKPLLCVDHCVLAPGPVVGPGSSGGIGHTMSLVLALQLYNSSGCFELFGVLIRSDYGGCSFIIVHGVEFRWCAVTTQEPSTVHIRSERLPRNILRDYRQKQTTEIYKGASKLWARGVDFGEAMSIMTDAVSNL